MRKLYNMAMRFSDYFKYCPRCQKKLKNKEEKLIHCENCDFHFYFTPYDTNALIIENKKNEIMLVKRRSPPKQGYWDLPGGFVEFRENMEESTKREIKEELGIDVRDIQYVMSTPDIYFYKGVNYPTLCFTYIAKVGNVKMKPHDDITELRFFPKNKIPYNRIAFSGIKKALRFYLTSFDKSPGAKSRK